jgi:hypothetical protein
MLGVEPVDVPQPEDMDSFSDGDYWQRADLRLVLRLDSNGLPVTTLSPTGVEVVDADGVTDTSATTALHHASCTGEIGEGADNYVIGNRGPADAQKLRLFREYQSDPVMNDYEVTLEVDLQNLFNCMHRFPEILGGKGLNDETEDGLARNQAYLIITMVLVFGMLMSSRHRYRKLQMLLDSLWYRTKKLLCGEIIIVLDGCLLHSWEIRYGCSRMIGRTRTQSK